MIYLGLAKRFWPFILAAVLFGAGYGYGHHSAVVAGKAKLDALQRDYDTFKIEVAAQGEAAQKAAEAAEKAYQVNKEKADNDYQNRINGLTADVERLRRKDSANRNALLGPSPSSSDPETAKILRAQYEQAHRRLVDGLRSIGLESDEGIAALDSVKDWTNR